MTTWDSETIATPVTPIGLNGCTFKLSSVRSSAATMSSKARSTTSGEFRLLHSHSSRTRWRPTLFMTLPPPENDGRDRATDPLDAVLGDVDREPLQRQTSPRKALFHHPPHDPLGDLPRRALVLEDH